MRSLIYLLIGTVFGIVMTKSEAVSWFRIQEMFRFESFHMYGIIGTAVVVGAIGVALAKKMGWKTVDGNEWKLNPKDFTVPRYILGGDDIRPGLGYDRRLPGADVYAAGAGDLGHRPGDSGRHGWHLRVRPPTSPASPLMGK